MAQVYCFINKKGGVGKSTCSSILGQLLAICGKKVLAIDNDEQHHMTNLLGLKTGDVNIGNLYKESYTIVDFARQAILQSNTEGLHCITAPADLNQVSVRRKYILRDFLKHPSIQKMYDYILIDNVPGILNTTEAAIVASDKYVLPVIMKKLSFDGLMEMITSLQNNYAINMQDIIIMPNMVRKIQRQQAYLIALQTLYPNNTVKTEIPLDESLDEIAAKSTDKVLFINKYSALSVAHYLKAAIEIFSLDEKDLYESVLSARSKHKSDVSRKYYLMRKKIQEAHTPEPEGVVTNG